MTHYRLTLTKGRGPKMTMIAERHSYSKTPPSGWWRSVKLLGSSIHVRVCWTPDEACDALKQPGGNPVTGAAQTRASAGDSKQVLASTVRGAHALPVDASPHTPTPSPKDSERP